MIGQTISHYRITARLGAGGMGEIFLADDLTLDRPVALKFLPQEVSNDPAARERLIREAKAASRLSHPNVLTVHAVDADDGRDFIVMEYIEGPTLREVIDRGCPSMRDASRIAAEIAAGLATAHRQQITHRDIKPTNIMLTRDGTAKIMDFGLARVQGRSEITKEGTILGTVSYMSPEQVKGLPVDSRSDVFSLGVVLYELVTGRRPFDGAHDAAIMYSVCNEQPVSPCKHNDAVPAEMEQIILRALAKDPNDRYPDAAALLNDLRPVTEVRPALNATPDRFVAAAPAAQPVRSLAVLYLRNLGRAEDEFLSYGITEDLIVDLTRVGSLRVSPMRAVLKFRDSDADLAEIASSLDADVILDGSLHKFDGGIRISAQLVDVASAKNLWAERWEESVEDLPRIKQALAQGISRALSVDSAAAEAAQVGRPEGKNPRAYEHYLRGKYVFEHKKDESDIRVARELYREALAEEPSLVAARAGLAELTLYTQEESEARIELDKALTDARAQGLRADEARILRLMALWHMHRGEYGEAERWANDALQIARALGDVSGEAATLGTMIAILEFRAEYDKAVGLFERVLEINRSLNDQDRAAEALLGMAGICMRKGDYSRIRDLVDEVFQIARSKGDVSLEIPCTNLMGAVSYNAGDWDQALGHYQTCLELQRRLGHDEHRMAGLWDNMALVHFSRGNYRECLRLCRQAAAALKHADKASLDAYTPVNMGAAHSVLGEYDKAVELTKSALEIAQRQNHPLIVASAHATLGATYLRMGDASLSELSYARALDAADAVGLTIMAMRCHAGLGELHFLAGSLGKGRHHLQQAILLNKDIADKQIVMRAGAYLAAIAAIEGDTQGGTARLRETLTQARDHGDPQYVLIAQRLLGQTLLEHGSTEADRNEGRTILEEALELARQKEIVYEVEWIGNKLETG